jgi:hypothetical protein
MRSARRRPPAYCLEGTVIVGNGKGSGAVLPLSLRILIVGPPLLTFGRYGSCSIDTVCGPEALHPMPFGN